MYYNNVKGNIIGGNKVEKEYTLRICGNQCTIISSESEENVKAIALEVEEKINAMYKENTRVSLALAAILTAMDFCEELKEVREGADNFRGQLKTYLDDAAKSADERDEALREIERLRREVDALRARLAGR